jgi:hypothetical protein
MKAGATTSKGWLLKIDVDTNLDGTLDVSRTNQVAADKVTTVAELITALGTFATDFEFTITAGANNLIITPDAGVAIRLNPDSDLGILGLDGFVYSADPIVRNNAYTQEKYAALNGAKTFNGRADYVAYLDSIAAAPVAAVSSVAPSTAGTNNTAVVAAGANILFTATASNGPVTYQWSFSDGVAVPAGLTATRSFTTVNTVVLATLKVTNTITGEISSISKPVQVAFAGNFTVGHTVPNALYPRKIQLNLSGMTAPHTSVRVEWGDGTTNNYTNSTATLNAPLTGTKTYYGTVDRTVKVRILNGTKQIDEKSYLVDMP